ncbi:DUF4393 domain-containing protein [Clostridium sp. NSJ-49]|uniref:DUF4393 domain-containing protein n=1 Tax=Clostridium sp. NSJ-49 TaxID=2763034 RepID=UPI00164C542F|nr:DUF4393 domain-containing protein [Clostridium sp. NSJ-49]MBC5625642.1 DUF4393 domain-containing protein [Clostridium sp. NSJ-49]
MEEINVNKVITEVAKEQSKEIYQDGFKGAMQEGGKALQSIVGLFNNVILYPVKKANITYKYKLEEFENDLKLKIQDTPRENLIEAPISIVGPTIESLKYTIDTPEVREMYLNLLGTSMNVESVIYAHPSYVEIIKQMSPLDAKVLKKIVEIGQSIKCSWITICFDTKYFIQGMPKIFTSELLIEDYDPFLISASIENLCRLGLLVHYDAGIANENYEILKEHWYVQERFNLFKNNNPDKFIELKSTRETLDISNFGENFAKACL